MANLKCTKASIVYQCAFCNQPFHRKHHWGVIRFCSNKCKSAYQTANPKPLAERFWSHVQKTDGCWLWTAGLSHGYGQIMSTKNGRYRPAVTHRVSWEVHNGPIPEGMDVCHHCDNPPCVRPDHLFLGTTSDNMNDMTKKGRHGRALYVTFQGQSVTLSAFARMIGIPQHTVWRYYHKHGLSIEAIHEMALTDRRLR